MSRSGEQRGIKLVIGVVASAMAVILLYFSAWPTLTCTRGSGPGVDCAVTARALGFITVADDRVTGVVGADMVASATGRSRTPPRIMFRSGGTRRDLGYFLQLFSGDQERIDEFARGSTEPQLRLTKELTFQTVAAHLAMLFLATVGIGMIVASMSRSR
jgi:hypothetical protein